jgi:UDP-N-acetylmuramoyl-L-alanyl-D-glutamate--2,6-diaminopimelate ligase
MNTAEIMARQMRLSELLQDEVVIPDSMDVELTGIEMDSRCIEPGDLFLAYQGATHDGRHFVDEVIARGANAVLVEKDEEWSEIFVREGVPVIPVDNLSTRIGKIAARFFDNPAASFALIGITGTNGKTSCCQFIGQCLDMLGYKCGISGTLGHGMYGEPYNYDDTGPGTTPDAIKVQRIFEEVRIRDGEVMVMEVSSHGLNQKRVNVNEFDVAVFTNLSRDHLDYHGGMTAYGDEKRKLFMNPQLKIAVINMDDIFSAKILNSLSKTVKCFTYSLHNPKADVFPRALEFKRSGFSLDVVTPWGEGCFSSTLAGSFNVSNILAVLTTVMATEADKPGFDFNKILEKVAAVSPVRGRMEILGDHPVSVVIDYAHTPEGLKNALSALRQHYKGDIWCVFGCGGNRDKGKRPLMAEIAEQLASKLIITDDNPRTEDSGAIIKQILTGLSGDADVVVESDRAKAIDYAISNAAEGDVVLIAGKGHEEYQDVGGNRMVFSDVKQARVCLNKRFAKKITGTGRNE